MLPPPRPARLWAALRHPLFSLALVTALGAALRFWSLWRPAFWIDEAAVYRRICGTLSDTLERIADSGFTPLHYLLYWAIKQFATMTPFVMRTPTAIAGTAMVPAMYWLALRTVRSRPKALAVALFTACGAYPLVYSRDAKMYIECWSLVTISTACLLWWLDARRWYAWLGWWLSGALALGFHATAAMVVLVQAIMFVTHSHWRRVCFSTPAENRGGVLKHILRGLAPVGLFVAGLMLIVAPTVVYYSTFNRYPERVNKDWDTSGLKWIEMVNGGRDATQMLRLMATTYLSAWDWPLRWDARAMDQRLLWWLTTGAIVMYAIIGVGAFPWRRKDRTREVGRPLLADIDAERRSPPADLVVRGSAASRPGVADLPEELSAVPWRPLLWIGAWLILPTYGVYCASTQDAWAPWTWFTFVREYPQWFALAAAVGAVGLWWRSATWRLALLKLAATIAIAATLFALCVLIQLVTPTQPSSVWVPRYLGVIWPAYAIAVGALVMRLPTRPVRWIVIAMLIGVNLTRHAAFVHFAYAEPPTEMIAADLLAARDPASQTRTYLGVRNRWLVGPADQFFSPVLPYYVYALGGSHVRPKDYPTQWVREFNVKMQAFPTNVAAPQDLARGEVPAQLKRVIVWHEWSRLAPGQRDALLTKLGKGWTFAGEQTWLVYDRWTWRPTYTISRRVYERE